GVLGAVLALIVFPLKNKVALAPLADAAALGLPIGHALGRLGCFAAGCCYGKVSTWPLATSFPRSSIAFQTLRAHGRLPEGASITPGLFPSQPVEAALDLALFVGLV